MPDSEATIEPYEALQRLGAFIKEHEACGGKPYIEDESITLVCDAHTPPVYEILTMESMALRRAMGEELSESRALTWKSA